MPPARRPNRETAAAAPPAGATRAGASYKPTAHLRPLGQLRELSARVRARLHRDRLIGEAELVPNVPARCGRQRAKPPRAGRRGVGENKRGGGMEGWVEGRGRRGGEGTGRRGEGGKGGTQGERERGRGGEGDGGDEMTGGRLRHQTMVNTFQPVQERKPRRPAMSDRLLVDNWPTFDQTPSSWPILGQHTANIGQRLAHIDECCSTLGQF